jgi:Na+/citrate or Na+/malate symporter
MFTALLHGMIAGMIFLIVGNYVGIEQYRLEITLNLPMIGGMAAYLWYVYWQFDKYFCECE